MKKIFLALIPVALMAIGVAAQDAAPVVQATPEQRPANLLQQLGLSPDQLRQVRQINVQRKPLMDDAQRRVREANRALDAAIYADVIDETTVQSRLADLQQAQGDVARIRFNNELSIRKILTPDQLGRFREMREQVAQRIRENVQRRQQRIKDNSLPGLAKDPSTRRLIRQQNRLNNKQQSLPMKPKPQN